MLHRTMYLLQTLDKHRMKRWRASHCISIVLENNRCTGLSAKDNCHGGSKTYDFEKGLIIKFFKSHITLLIEVICGRNFQNKAKKTQQKYLSLFASHTTVQKRKIKKKAQIDKKLFWPKSFQHFHVKSCN